MSSTHFANISKNLSVTGLTSDDINADESFLIEYSIQKFENYIQKISDKIVNSLFVYSLHPLNHKLPTFFYTYYHKILGNEEENFIIHQIFNHQFDNDFFTSRDVRDIASEIFKEPTGDERSFSRDWVRNFLKRHADEIDKIKTCSVDDDRANIDLEEVNTYIETIEEVLSHDPNPLLFLNMDESGFGRRPEKGKRNSTILAGKQRCVSYILSSMRFGCLFLSSSFADFNTKKHGL